MDIRKLHTPAMVFLLAAAAAGPARPQQVKSKPKKPISAEAAAAATPVLWIQPDSIAARDTLEGPGGGTDVPQGPVQFVAEDMNGSNPKFDIKAADGTAWKVKMGDESRPETAADHLLWALGYYVTEDYFVPELHVEGLPAHLKRGQDLVGPGDLVRNVRLKRMVGKDEGTWKWKENPFVGTQPFNGLRVMMCLINNWDLKDVNNTVYRVGGKDPGDGAKDEYVITDLGSSFGTTGQYYSGKLSKGNVKSYEKSGFITHVTPTAVTFRDPTLPPLPIMLRFAGEAPERIDMEWIKRDVPRADVAWIGGLLAQLTPEQIRNLFRSAGFTDAEVDGFASELTTRIDALNHLDGYASTAGAGQ